VGLGPGGGAVCEATTHANRIAWCWCAGVLVVWPRCVFRGCFFSRRSLGESTATEGSEATATPHGYPEDAAMGGNAPVGSTPWGAVKDGAGGGALPSAHGGPLLQQVRHLGESAIYPGPWGLIEGRGGGGARERRRLSPEYAPRCTRRLPSLRPRCRAFALRTFAVALPLAVAPSRLRPLHGCAKPLRSPSGTSGPVQECSLLLLSPKKVGREPLATSYNPPPLTNSRRQCLSG